MLSKNEYNKLLINHLIDYNDEYDENYKIYKKDKKLLKIKKFLLSKSLIRKKYLPKAKIDDAHLNISLVESYWNDPQLTDLTCMSGEDDIMTSYGRANLYIIDFNSELGKNILANFSFTKKEFINMMFQKYYLSNGFSYYSDFYNNKLYIHTFEVYEDEIHELLSMN